ncbi:unnamed protein product [Dovyalis caffra]|uniref:Ribonuclease H1 N-terminal domain-containing protein n=1 Tax=Dovyalis caffra TaxID=77055 RepID=A0AAV1R4R0_9ROSI|nr:unnamed protein product [Dovyalis caffra]
MARNKAYVVFRGRAPEVYLSWEDCEAQVIGFPGTLYRGFKNHFEAEKSWLVSRHPNTNYKFIEAKLQEIINMGPLED